MAVLESVPRTGMNFEIGIAAAEVEREADSEGCSEESRRL